MSTTIERTATRSNRPGASRPSVLANVLLSCGIVATLLYVVANIVGDVVWDAYSLKSFTVSELSAIDAPSRPAVPVMMIVFGVLSVAFAIGVLLAGRGRGLRVTGCLLVAVGVMNLAGPFVPMHLRGNETSLTDTMHIVVTGVTGVLLTLAVWFGRKAFDPGFRVYSLITIAVMLGFGALAAADGPAIAANDPTPWVGVTERLCIGAYLLWMVALSGALLCTPAPDQANASARIDERPSAILAHRTPASSER